MSHPPIRAGLLALASCLLPLAAHAATVTFSGTAAPGPDPLGQTYATTLGPFAEPGTPNSAGFPTWGETFQTDGGALEVFTGAPNLTHATSFTFTYTGSQPQTIRTAFDTGFTVFASAKHPGGAWDTSVSGDTVTFTAEPGMALNIGENFDVIVGFTNDINPNDFSFTASWNGVPEPATWSIMAVGVGLLGGALRLNQRKAQAFA